MRTREGTTNQSQYKASSMALFPAFDHVLISNFALGNHQRINLTESSQGQKEALQPSHQALYEHNKQVVLPLVNIQVQHEEPGNMHP